MGCVASTQSAYSGSSGRPSQVKVPSEQRKQQKYEKKSAASSSATRVPANDLLATDYNDEDEECIAMHKMIARLRLQDKISSHITSRDNKLITPTLTNTADATSFSRPVSVTPATSEALPSWLHPVLRKEGADLPTLRRVALERKLLHFLSWYETLETSGLETPSREQSLSSTPKGSAPSSNETSCINISAPAAVAEGASSARESGEGSSTTPAFRTMSSCLLPSLVLGEGTSVMSESCGLEQSHPPRAHHLRESMLKERAQQNAIEVALTMAHCSASERGDSNFPITEATTRVGRRRTAKQHGFMLPEEKTMYGWGTPTTSHCFDYPDCWNILTHSNIDRHNALC